MRLSGLKLRHFRNLGVQDLEFPPEGAAIVGENAQGKSNLLEAIYYLETFRSFRGARDDQLVAFDEEVFHVAGRVEGPGREEPVEVAGGYQRSGRKKKVTVNGAEPDRIGDALGKVGLVVFSPADVGVVSEGPSERRRFLDIVLSLNDPGYLPALQRFRQILSQRNAALREEAPPAAVHAWDDGLVETGGRVMEGRRRWVDRWAGPFGAYYRTVSGGQGARMTYDPSAALDGAVGVDEVTEAYRRVLTGTRDRERRVGNTVVGPQRDELLLTLGQEEGGLEIREYGSGGQIRTAALALRLVEGDTIREAREQEPIILMDDVFAELDAGRSERILDLIDRQETGQVILTAPKESDVKIRQETLPRWRIRHGEVSCA